jgi:hypothetical protein
MTTPTGQVDKPSTFYITSVSVLTFVLPVIGLVGEHFATGAAWAFGLYGKWFIFSAVGLRLFLAGIKQVKDPAFTAKQIFHMSSEEVYPVLRELGFANMCFGLVGIVSLFRPDWRIVSAFASGLYFGIAAVQHGWRGAVGINERFALWTDLVIFGVLLAYCVCFW